MSEQPSKPSRSDLEFRAVDNLNEAVFNLYEHAAARHLDTLSPELADRMNKRVLAQDKDEVQK